MVLGVGRVAAALATVAPLASQAVVLNAGEPTETSKILFGTMTFPEDTLPLDVTLGHQVRMVSQHPELVETVIVDNRPPFMTQVSRQEEILKMMQTSGQADIIRVNYKDYDRPKYLQKFFATGDPSNSTKTIEGAHDVSDISGQHMSTNAYGMFTFLDRCLASPSTTNICIFLDPDIIVYRDGKGMAELAQEAFDQNPHLIAINPPTMCSWDAPASVDGEGIGLKRVGMLSQRYLILNRGRLAEALPLHVPHSQFDVNFEHLFDKGMKYSSQWSRRMTCGHTFAIHPFSGRWAHCRNKAENLHIVKHAEITANASNLRWGADTHYGFDMRMVTGLRELFRRVEAGKLPKPQDPWSTTNGCEDICVNKSRVADGLAW